MTNTVTGEVTRFVYDGDGNRVLRIDGSGTTVTIGDYYEKQGNVIRKYYYAGGQRIAVRVGGVVYYLHSDHLGSATLTTDLNGNRVGELRYTPYGVTRYEWGSTPTNRRYTGQRWEEALRLYDYRARYYDPALGRFVRADTIVPEPGNPQSLNRYAYVLNNPVRYTDPSGYCIPGVNCPGDVSGIEHPPDPSGLRGEAYAAWLTHYILWQEQQRAETGGTLDIELGQQAAAFELSSFLMKDPELLGDILYQQVAAAAPQLIAQAAGAATDVLISGAGWALGMVRQAAQQRIGGTGLKMLPAPPPGSVNPWEGPIESIVLQQETVMYRVWGGESGRVGQWLTPTRPKSSTSARQLLALPDSNTAEYVSEVVVPAGTRIQVGRAAANFGQQGGALQVQLLVKPSELSPSWFGPGQRLP